MAARREHRGRQKRPSRAQRRAAPRRARPRARARDRPPDPALEPETVVAHVGPTNSGKTHSALEFLAEAGRGVFAAPLRMLAQEAHRRLRAQLGEEQVGLVTGEERVNEDAPIICCTAEMAPMYGEVLVLDEVQWADDEERGSAWTRLLLAGEYRHILLLGAVEALPLVQNAFPEAEMRFFERKAPLDWTGEVAFQSLKPGTVVVAFSRRAVLALAGELNRRHPGRVAVLYGAMPLAVAPSRDRPLPERPGRRLLRHRRARPRRQPPLRDAALRRDEEVRRPGAARPARVGDRADRRPRRPLRPRRARPRRRAHRDRLGAGRPGAGRVGARRRTSSSRAGISATASSTRRGIRPRLEDLPIESPQQLPAALRAWHNAALRQWATEGWLSVESIGPLLARLDAVQRRLRSAAARSRSSRRGSSSTRPSTRTTASSSATLALAVAGDRAQRPVLAWLLDVDRLRDASLEDAEQAARTASILRWFALQYPGVGGVTIEKAAALEQAAAERVSARLAAEVRSPSVGRCKSCGQSCAPWFPLCDRCYGRGR